MKNLRRTVAHNTWGCLREPVTPPANGAHAVTPGQALADLLQVARDVQSRLGSGLCEPLPCGCDEADGVPCAGSVPDGQVQRLERAAREARHQSRRLVEAAQACERLAVLAERRRIAARQAEREAAAA